MALTHDNFAWTAETLGAVVDLNSDDLRNQGQEPRGGLALQHRLADRLVILVRGRNVFAGYANGQRL